MTQTIQFNKMHGLGNDFVVMDCITQEINVGNIPIPVLADRHLGIGFDQLLLIEKSNSADFACTIINADGSYAEQCGNGIRCVARFIIEEKLSDKKHLTIETKGGIVAADIDTFDKISVSLGTPTFLPAKIPFLTPNLQKIYTIEHEQMSLSASVLSMGNPHAIIRVASVSEYPVTDIGQSLSIHPAFPCGANVGFLEIIDRNHIKLRTFERGTGETLACGTNASAAVVSGIVNDWLDSEVTVILSHGTLNVKWLGETNPVILTGPAVKVFNGLITL